MAATATRSTWRRLPSQQTFEFDFVELLIAEKVISRRRSSLHTTASTTTSLHRLHPTTTCHRAKKSPNSAPKKI
jgi:hypothetical protein